MSKNQFNIPILVYQRVVEDPVPEAKSIDIWVSKSNLEKQFAFLMNKGIEPINFAMLRKMKPEECKGNVILSFDDGYADNYELLFPLLQKFRFTAVIYFVSRRQNNLWDVELHGSPSYPQLNAAQIHEMKNTGIEFGSHSRTHPNLLALEDVQLEAEIMGSKRDLDDALGQGTISFAYPFGGCDERIEAPVRAAGYPSGIITKNGPYSYWEDPFRIRRMLVRSGTGLLQFRRKASGYYYHPNLLKSVFY